MTKDTSNHLLPRNTSIALRLWCACCFALSLTVQTSALTAPYLIDVVAQSSRSAMVTWRNNDLNSAGFVIQCKLFDSTDFGWAGATGGNQATFSAASLQPETKYVFRVLAFAGSDTSAPSNEDSVTTLPGKAVVKPNLGYSAFFDSTQHYLALSWIDSCEIERGFKVSRSVYPTWDQYEDLGVLDSPDPSAMGQRGWNDYNVEPNRSYRYRIDALTSRTDSVGCWIGVFPLDYSDMISPEDSVLTVDSVLSGIPIRYNRWSMQYKDTLFLSELGSPPGYTIINVADPTRPSFVGYSDQMVYGCITRGCCILSAGSGCVGRSIAMCKYQDGFHCKNILSLGFGNATPVLFYDDSTFLVIDDDGGMMRCGITGDTVQTYRYSFAFETLWFRDVPIGKTWKGIAFIVGISRMLLSWADTTILASALEPNSYQREFTLDRIPDQVDKYFFVDTLKKARNRILDKDKKVVYCFCDSALWIYSYKLCTKAEHVAETSLRRGSKPLKRALGCDRIEVYDLLGRRMLSLPPPFRARPGAMNGFSARQPLIILYRARGKVVERRMVGAMAGRLPF